MPDAHPTVTASRPEATAGTAMLGTSSGLAVTQEAEGGSHRRIEMKEQQVREVAKAVVKARFGDIEIVSVKPGLDPYDEAMVNAKIIYDDKVE